MKDLNWDRMAVVTALHGEKYLGWIPEEMGDPKKYLDENCTAGKPVVIHDARNLMGQAQPNIDARGNILGISKMLLLMPIDAMNGPLPVINVISSTWYLVPENDSVRKKFEELLNASVETEARLSASDAGIHIPGLRRPQ